MYEHDRDLPRLKAWTNNRIGARVAHVAEREAISKAKAAAELVRLGLEEHIRREKRQRAEWGESLHTLPPDDGDGVRLKIPLDESEVAMVKHLADQEFETVPLMLNRLLIFGCGQYTASN